MKTLISNWPRTLFILAVFCAGFVSGVIGYAVNDHTMYNENGQILIENDHYSAGWMEGADFVRKEAADNIDKMISEHEDCEDLRTDLISTSRLYRNIVVKN